MRLPDLGPVDCKLVTDVMLASVEVAIFFAEPQIAVPVGVGIIVVKQVIEEPPNIHATASHIAEGHYRAALEESVGYMMSTAHGCWRAGIPGALGRLLASSRALVDSTMAS